MPGQTILVVDDEERQREIYRDILRDEGYDTETTASGESALRLLGQKRFDLVLTDLNLTGMTGIELLSGILAADPTVAVVLITGYPSIPSAIEATKKGVLQILVNALLGGLDRGRNGGITRNEDDGDGGVGGEDAAQKLDAGHPGQVEVGQDQIKAFLAQETQSRLAARRRLSVVAFVPQDVAVDFALAFLVVNHQDGLAGHEGESLRGGWRCRRGQLGDRAAGKRKLDDHDGAGHISIGGDDAYAVVFHNLFRAGQSQAEAGGLG